MAAVDIVELTKRSGATLAVDRLSFSVQPGRIVGFLGLGALVGNQVGAIVGAPAWTFLVENLLTIVPGLGDQVQKYGLGGVSNALSDLETENTEDLLGRVPGGLLLAAYAAAFVVADVLALRRRDVTS